MAEGFYDFTPGQVLTAAQVDDYLMRQAVMRFDDATARTTALSGVLVEGMMSYLKDTNTVEVYDGSAWVGVGGVSAANFTDTETGTYSSGGKNYKYLTFTASGTITIDTAGIADVLIVGGGGGSGASFSSGRCGGGGGAGGYAYHNSMYLQLGTLTVTIGAGGAAGVGLTTGGEGTYSALDQYSTGGGGGASPNSNLQGTNGISGGGGGDGSRIAGLSVNPAQGNDGANGGSAGTAGGGGGSSAAASTSTGGAGTSNSITNSATTYAAGGDGGTTGSGASVPGAANTGDGATGPGTTGNGASGGSGVVIVRVEV